MAEHSLYGKRKLCYTEISDFTDYQGIGHDPLYKRYDSVFSVVRRVIDKPYQGFLAHPLYAEDDDQIQWYVDDWKETPVRLVDITDGAKRAQYEQIKKQTLQHYRNSLTRLSDEELLVMAGALRYIDDDYIYCFDGKVAVVAWGMTIDSKQHKVKGSVIHEMDITRKYTLSFNPGQHGRLENVMAGSVHKEEGYVLTDADFPQLSVDDGYMFTGWSPAAVGTPVNGDIAFTATYQLIPPPQQPQAPEPPYNSAGIATPPPLQEPYTASPQPDTPEPPKVKATFVADSGFGILNGQTEFWINQGDVLKSNEVPIPQPLQGYRFLGWSPSVGNPLYQDTVFTARFDGPQVTEVVTEHSWWRGCLNWLLWTLLALLALALLLFFLRSCTSCGGAHYTDPIGWFGGSEDTDTVIEAPDSVRAANGWEIEDNGKVEDLISSNGTLPDEDVVAPALGDDGELPPIVRNPGMPDVIANRLNLYFDNANADLNRFAREFKQAYPGDAYSIIGCDNNVKMVQIMVPESQRDRIRNEIPRRIPGQPFFVVDESIFELSGLRQTQGTDPGWHLNAVNARQGWSYTKGSRSVTVAVVDDGLDASHPMFRGKIYMPYNVFTRNNRLSYGQGHGTHVAGLAVGSDAFLGRGASGIAPGCRLMPVQVFDNNYCTFSSLTSGIMYAVHKGADVVNVSVGPSFPGLNALPLPAQEELSQTRFKNEERVWRKIISIANRKNSVIVFAAGNDDVLASIPPENRTNYTVNVAAVGKDLSVTKFSNYGQGTNISAPGAEIYSSYPVRSFAFFDGTSMSAPIVSGTIALMKSLNKRITVGQALRVLQSSGRPVGDGNPPMVQVDKALAMVRSGKLPDGRQHPSAAQLEGRPSNEDDYAAIRRQIAGYQQKIKELERKLPANRR